MDIRHFINGQSTIILQINLPLEIMDKPQLVLSKLSSMLLLHLSLLMLLDNLFYELCLNLLFGKLNFKFNFLSFQQPYLLDCNVIVLHFMDLQLHNFGVFNVIFKLKFLQFALWIVSLTFIYSFSPWTSILACSLVHHSYLPSCLGFGYGSEFVR